MSPSTTPPSSATAPAERSAAAPTTPLRPRLTAAGGTNPERWPVKVDRHPGEALESWLRTLAHRYGLTPRAALGLLGATVLPQRLARLHPTLAAVGLDRVAEQLALNASHLAPDPLFQALEQARRGYLRTFHDYATLEVRGLRYCPACLTEDEHWQASWASPLHAVCVRHQVHLATTCPACENVPYQSPVWLTATTATWRCPGLFAPAPPHRYSRRCGTDLRATTAPWSATPEEVQAQQVVLDLATAHTGDGAVRCCGIDAPSTLALEAILDLVHAQLCGRFYLTSPAEPVRRLVNAFTIAVDITSQPTPAAARELATWCGLLGPQDPQAPIGPTHLIRARPHSRVLEAMTLLSLRDHASIDAGLRFRLGSHLPCYPAQNRHPRDIRHLHPDQGLTDLPMNRIPALVWPQLLASAPAEAVQGTDLVIVRAAASMALAKTASTRRWHLLATDLGLPATLASPIRCYWRRLHDDHATWTDYLAWVDTTFVALHRSDVPIDYQLRRAVAANHGFLTACAREVLTAGTTPRPPGLGPTSLVRLFWPIFTASELDLAPTPTPPPDVKAARLLRTLRTDPSPLLLWLDALHQRVATEFPDAAGPLTWVPP